MTLEAVDLLLRLGVLPDVNLASTGTCVEVAVVKVDQYVCYTILGPCQVFEEENEFTSACSG